VYLLPTIGLDELAAILILVVLLGFGISWGLRLARRSRMVEWIRLLLGRWFRHRGE
jgi:hypothetical protein